MALRLMPSTRAHPPPGLPDGDLSEREWPDEDGGAEDEEHDDDEDDERDYVAMMQRHPPHHRGSSGSNSVVPEGCEAMAMVRRILRRLIAASAPPKQGDYNNTLKTSFWPSIPWAHRGWTTRSGPTRGQDSPIWGSHQTAAKAWRQAPDNHDGRGAGSSLFLSLQG